MDDETNLMECELCYGSFDSHRNLPIQVTCCKNILCEECVENILEKDKTRCPWCKSHWNRKRFLLSCKDSFDSNVFLKKLKANHPEAFKASESTARAVHNLGDGALKEDYEHAKSKAMQERLEQLKTDEMLAREMSNADSEHRAVTSAETILIHPNRSPTSLAPSNIGQMSSQKMEEEEKKLKPATTTFKRMTTTTAKKVSGNRERTPLSNKLTNVQEYFKPRSQSATKDRVGDSWICKMCTFANHLLLSQCEMCDFDERKSATCVSAEPSP